VTNAANRPAASAISTSELIFRLLSNLARWAETCSGVPPSWLAIPMSVFPAAKRLKTCFSRGLNGKLAHSCSHHVSNAINGTTWQLSDILHYGRGPCSVRYCFAPRWPSKWQLPWMSPVCRFCSLIPVLAVKLSSDHPCGAHCSVGGRGKPSA
jgi:hypothetical protein